MFNRPDNFRKALLTSTALVTFSVVASSLGGAAHAGSFTVTAGTTNAGAETLLDGETGTIELTGTQSGTVDITGNTNINLTNDGSMTGSVFVNNTIGGSGLVINNSGTITSASTGISSYSTSDISGGIVNSGMITGGSIGIYAGTNSDISGGITNSGTISNNYQGIRLLNSGDISGGITNSGTISGLTTGISVAIGSDITGEITNSGTIVGGSTGIFVSSSSDISGGIINSGTITGTGGTAIHIAGAGATAKITNTATGTITGHVVIGAGDFEMQGGTVTGDVTSLGGGDFIVGGDYSGISGTVSGFGAVGIGNDFTLVNTGTDDAATALGTAATDINIHDGTLDNQLGGTITGVVNVAGGVTNAAVANAGLISGGSQGIAITSTDISGGITNSGSIVGAFTGINLATSSDITGGITNSGTINGASGTGIYVGSGSDISGGIVSSGTIVGGSTGIRLSSSANISGGIANSGMISGISTGFAIVNSSNLSGEIANSGTISGGIVGIAVESGSDIAGGITNSGLISGSSSGILVSVSSDILGGITNSGTISSAFTAIKITSSSDIWGGIANSGTIVGGGTAIFATSNSDISGGIINSGTITGTGGTAIDIANATATANVTNTATGTITGHVVMGVGDFEMQGGTVTGDVTGQPSGDFIIGGDYSGISGTVSGFGQIGIGNGFTLVNTGTDDAATALGLGTYINIHDGTLDNQLGGTITGSISVEGGATNAVVNNAGTISGGSSTISINAANATVINAGTMSGGGTGMYIGQTSDVSGGITNSGLIEGIFNGIYIGTSSNVSGGIVNSGTISSTTSAIILDNSSDISGGITNSGTISGSSYGIHVMSLSDISGGIANSGIISGGSRGVYVASASDIFGGIDNSGTISGLTGVFVDSLSDISGGIINSGTITGGGGTAINITNAGATGNVTNTAAGTITGHVVMGAGYFEMQGGTVTGDVTGGGGSFSIGGDYSGISGTISGFGSVGIGGGFTMVNAGTDDATTTLGTSTQDIYIYDGTLNNQAGGLITGAIIATGGVTNAALINAGTISGASTGVLVTLTSDLSGGITNSGTIHGTGYGIYVFDPSDIAGGINNTGTISSATIAIGVASTSDISGGVVNAAGATIVAPTAIVIDATSDITGDISNSGTITGSGGTAITVGNTAATVHLINNATGVITGDVTMANGWLTNVGTITGNVSMSAGTLEMSTGTITGTVTGTSSTFLTFASDYTTTRVLETFGLNVNGGTLTIGSDYGQTTPFGVTSIASGAAMGLGAGGSFTTTTMNNAGTLNISAGQSMSVTGNYTQVGAGVINIGLDGTSAGSLVVGGTADLSANNMIAVTATNLGFTPVVTFQDVISASAITTTAGTLNVTDLSVGSKHLFTAVLDANGNVDIVATFAQLSAILSPTASSNVMAVAAGFDDFFLANTSDADLISLIVAITALPDVAAQEKAIASLMSVVPGADVRAGEMASKRMASIISRHLDQTTPYEASAWGEPASVAKGSGLWVQAVGGVDAQDSSAEIDGYDTTIRGLAGGYDMALNTNLRIGGALSYTDMNLTGEASFGGHEIDVTEYQVAAYAHKVWGDDMFAKAMIGYGKSNYETQRSIIVGAFDGGTARGDYSGNQLQTSVDIGQRFAFNDKVAIVPSASLRYGRVSVSDYNEKGAIVANLSVDERTSTSIEAGLNTLLTYDFTPEGSQTKVRPWLQAGMMYDFREGDIKVDARLGASAPSFRTYAAERSQFSLTLGTGVQVFTQQGLSFSVGYSGTFEEGYNAHLGNVSVQMNF